MIQVFWFLFCLFVFCFCIMSEICVAVLCCVAGKIFSRRQNMFGGLYTHVCAPTSKVCKEISLVLKKQVQLEKGSL